MVNNKLDEPSPSNNINLVRREGGEPAKSANTTTASGAAAGRIAPPFTVNLNGAKALRSK